MHSVKLLLVRSNLLRRREGKPEWHNDDSYTVMDGEAEAGWISAEMRHGLYRQQGWRWALNTRGSTPERSSGFVPTLEEAKAAFKVRYVEYLAKKGEA